MQQALQLLVADDDQVDRMAIRRALLQSELRAQVTEVQDGAAALSALLAQPFDCALLDFRMPELDGLEVLRKARAALVQTPIVMLTGQGDEQLAVELMKAGAADYLTKSGFSSQQLSRTLHHALRLYEAEQQHRFLAELLPHVAWATRADGQVDSYNQRWFQYTGLPEGQSSSWLQVVHPEDLPQARARWQRSLETGEPCEMEVRLRRADGTWRWHLQRAQPMRDARGRVVRWFGAHFDVDDQKRAEERTARLQELTSAFSGALTPQQVVEVLLTQGVSMLEAPAGLVGLVSEEGRELVEGGAWGYPEQGPHRGWRLALEAPQPLAEAVRRNVLRVCDLREQPELAPWAAPQAASGTLVAVPLRTGRGCVGLLAVSLPGPCTLSPAQQELFLAVARRGAQALERARLYEAAQRARTAAEQSEARLRRLLEEQRGMEAALKERGERLRAALSASGTGTFRWDLRTGALECDEGLGPILGLQQAQGVHSLDDLLARVHPEDREKLGQRLAQCVRGETDLEVDFRVAWPDGSEHWLTGKGRSFCSSQGQPSYLMGACVDISMQKRQEAEVRQRAAFERQLLGIVSHDLRHPLSVIYLSASALLARGELSEQQSSGVQRILSASERASRFIRDLLEFSQARLSGGLPIERRPMDLFELVRRAVADLAASRPERRLELVLHGGGYGEWDADRLTQVLDNLLVNALQHSPADCSVQVRCRGEQAAVVLEVHNGGPPIPAELLPHLFEPFRQGGGAGRTGGVGLGLYITRQLVLAHQGHITVNSTAEQGTCFTLWLPRRALGGQGPRAQLSETP